MSLRTPALAVGTVALSLLAAACSASTATTTAATPSSTAAPATSAPAPTKATTVYPDPDWKIVDPATKKIDPATLKAFADSVNTGASNCALTVKDGEIVQEDYWNGTTTDTRQEIWSATKSITSTLVGIAQDEGKLKIDQKASDYITEWKGTPSESITIKNLLSNDSGRAWDFETDYYKMAAGAKDKSAFAAGLGQQFPPGEHWEYNNSAIQTLETVLEKATGQDVEAYAKAKLFGPTGMGTTITHDPSGNTLAFMGAQASCRDMARFGYLALQRGKWKDQQVVTSAWVDEATKTSQDLNPGYGYLWWVNGQGPKGRSWPNMPDDAYAALGLGSQIVLVVPSRNLVMVRLGKNVQGDTVNSQGAMLANMAKYMPA
jgi:CubicO group peptidase (beta-lactamase class C family)